MIYSPQTAISKVLHKVIKYSPTILFSVALASTTTRAVAQAITPANDGTGTVVEQTDNTFDITGGQQAGSNLFHSFEQFGLDAGQIANILSNSDIDNVLGRVAGGDPSVLNGVLQVTGGDANLFLMNPAGVIFGNDFQLSVPGSFTATTADAIAIDDFWFNATGANSYENLAGTPSGFAFVNSDPGAVINAGELTVSKGEQVTLLGGAVVSTGTIEAPGGTINISSVPGENIVEISQKGSLLSLGLPVEVAQEINAPDGGLTADDIPALLSGEGIEDELDLVVENGVTKLASTDTAIPTNTGTTIVSGELAVSDASADGEGGAIDALGERVGLLGAALDASGTAGGGSVRIGGDYQGAGPVPNAKRTVVDESSTIDANALENGDGGRVVVWADEATQFLGNISARGGTKLGDGGFAEVSGRQSLSFDGIVDLSSETGAWGQLLLDPKNVIINDDGTSEIPLSGNILAGDSPGDTFSIADDKISAALLNGDVAIAATDEITVDSNIFSVNSDSSLTLSASIIDVNASISTGGDLTLVGENSIDIASAPMRSLTITSDRGGLSLVGGDIALTADGERLGLRTRVNSNLILTGNNISIVSNNEDTSLNAFSTRNITLDGGADVQLIAENNLTVKGNAIEISSGFEGDTFLQAGNDLQLNGSGTIPDFGDGTISLRAFGEATFSGENVTLDSTQGAVFIESSGNVSLQAEKTLAVIDAAGEDQQTQVLAGGDTLLQGPEAVNINALENGESFFISNGNLNLVSDGLTTGNGRFVTEGDILFTTLSGALGNFTYSPLSSSGVISADGNVSFGNYEGPSFKIEATGSITGGDITINSFGPTPTGSDPDEVILANSQSVILRAGLAPYQLINNRLPDLDTVRNQPNVSSSDPTFTVASTPDARANITVGNIDTTNTATTSDGIGTVILKASGDIRTGQIDTGYFTSINPFSVRVINELSITADGSINVAGALKDQSYPEFKLISISGNGLSINLNAGERILTDALETRDFDSSVELATQRDDIQVGYIIAGEGGIDISAAGTFQAVDSFVDTRAFPAAALPAEFVEFLIDQGYYENESDIPQNAQLLDGDRRVSLLVTDDGSFDADRIVPITIRSGDAQRIIAEETYSVAGNVIEVSILGDSALPFVIGPNYNGEAQFVPSNPTDNLSTFDPDNPFFRANDSSGLVFSSSEFPSFASGLSGGISVRSGGNASLYGNLQSQLFELNIPDETNRAVASASVSYLESTDLCEDSLANENNVLTVDETFASRAAGTSSSSTYELTACAIDGENVTE